MASSLVRPLTIVVLFEDYSALLLLSHAAAALACVGISTHLLIWLRPWLRGDCANHRSVRRFAFLAVAAYALTMLLGLMLYPTYRVRVRAEYLENPSAIRQATEARELSARRAAARNEESRTFRRGNAEPAEETRPGSSAGPLPALGGAARDAIADRAEERAVAGAKLVRWFDVKEHWSALGLLIAGALALLLRVPPWESGPTRRMGQGTFALAFAAAAIAWSAAVIGILLTAARSVAAL